MEERVLKGKKRAALYIVAPAIIFMITYYVVYLQASVPDNGDIVKHMRKALSLDQVLSISDCGWHFVCWLFHVCLPFRIEVAASVATASFNALTAIVVLWIQERYFDRTTQSVPLMTAVTLVCLLVGPLYLRFYNPNYYLGQGSPNVWHNPTTLAVRPFMLLIGVKTLDYWDCGEEETVTLAGRPVKKTLALELLLTAALFVSTLMKPSFLMVYCPVCAVVILYRLVKSRGRLFGKLVLQNLYFLPSLTLFLWQYIKIFIFGGSGSGDSGIEIAFFKVARLHAPSVAVSLLLKMAFPFLVILIWRKKIFKDKLFQLVFAQALVGLAITWTFAETGRRLTHGNFGWGNILASSFLWIFCVIFYARELSAQKGEFAADWKLKWKYGVPGVLLLWHLIAGVSTLTTYMHEF